MPTYEFAYNAIVLRFGSTTPYFPLTMSFGIFKDPISNHIFTSIDAYLGYHMFVRTEDKKEVLRAPNGYIADLNIRNLLKRLESTLDEEIIVPNWENDRDDIMFSGLRLKFEQSSLMLDMLRKTKDRPIFDASRRDEPYWCFVDGEGKNMHGKLLEKIREEMC
jgi:predicted NAD-dependent protein-ADP-ribosyltransferase YbiA (DUF1768 family)